MKIYLYKLAIFIALTIMTVNQPLANEGNEHAVKSFIADNKKQVIKYLKSYQTSSWNRKDVRLYLKRVYDDWAVTAFDPNIEKSDIKERNIWCGLNALSYAVEEIERPTIREKFVSLSLKAFNNSDDIDGNWNCDRWQVKPERVSIIQLIASPKEYHNKLVLVSGVASIEFENNSLFLSSEHYVYGLKSNAIWLRLNSNLLKKNTEGLEANNGKYVKIVGRYNSGCKGHKNMWAGCLEAISEISRIEK